MATLPTTGDNLDLVRFVLEDQPGYTHKLNLDRNRVTGMTDKRDALIQAVYLILNVERYAYPIYSRNYGSELTDLIGKPKQYAMSEIKRRITEALEQDDRITSVDTWTFETGRRSVLASFVVHSIYGDLDITKEVAI
jgi:phage baseplate assembly protein W